MARARGRRPAARPFPLPTPRRPFRGALVGVKVNLFGGDKSGTLRAGREPSLLQANDMTGMIMKIDAKQVLWWSFIAGIGFSLGGALITAPMHILNAWMKVTYFGG